MSAGDTQVQGLVHYYSSFQERHPYITDACNATDWNLVLEYTIQHEKAVIERRSQDLADNEVTIFQKAFLELCNDKSRYNAAVALWIEQIVGVDLFKAESRAQAITEMLAAKTSLHWRPYRQQNNIGDHTTVNTIPDSTQPSNLPSEIQSGPQSSQTSTGIPEHGATDQAQPTRRPPAPSPELEHPAFARLMSTYNTAITEFAAAPPKSIDRTQAAKFVRDTIENCLTYVSNNAGCVRSQAVEELVLDMERVLPYMEAIAQRGCGGKKRSFEQVEEGDLGPETRIRRRFESYEFDKERTGRGSYRNAIADPNPKRVKLGAYHVEPPDKTWSPRHIRQIPMRKSSVALPPINPFFGATSRTHTNRVSLLRKDNYAGAKDAGLRYDRQYPFHGDCYRPRYT